MTGAFGLQSITTATETTLVGGFGAADKVKCGFNSDLKKIHMWDGAAIESIASPPVPTVLKTVNHFVGTTLQKLGIISPRAQQVRESEHLILCLLTYKPLP